MSSVPRRASQLPVNALYVNITDVRSTIFTSDGLTKAGWVTSPGLGLSTIGGALFRDMGKTVYVPDPTVPTSVGSQSTILRKVQLVTGYFGTGAAAGSAAPGAAGEYFTGYIKLGAQTYGGGGDPSTAPTTGAAVYGFVRAN